LRVHGHAAEAKAARILSQPILEPGLVFACRRQRHLLVVPRFTFTDVGCASGISTGCHAKIDHVFGAPGRAVESAVVAEYCSSRGPGRDR
jgi:hypothetical protein